jgi:hypothetical protein
VSQRRIDEPADSCPPASTHRRGGIAAVVVLGALLGGCHSTRQPAPPAASSTVKTTTTPMTSTQSIPAATRIRPLAVRPVRGSKMTTSDKCPTIDPNAQVAPADVLVTCDLARTNLYTLGPEIMQIVLTRVDPPTPLTADYFEVHLSMDPSSAAAWATFTTDHLHAHIAFVRGDLVLEAPTIQEPVTSGHIALTTQTAAAADELARLAAQPE